MKQTRKYAVGPDVADFIAARTVGDLVGTDGAIVLTPIDREVIVERGRSEGQEA